MSGEAARYFGFWEELRPETTGRLHALARPDMRFRDPFNDVRGVERVVAMLDHMFEKAPDSAFTVLCHARTGDTVLARWRFSCTVRRVGPLRIEGMSEIILAPDGLVAEHRDHWDAAGQVYERLPLVGGLLRRIRGRFAFEG
ncbi:nuclear transport factor 2 family protein [Geminicoccaceae bacterium 1502E]|nr:nuclear transport factor 2 family protein [Geminicoccaceae bacterium 1502E]